MTLAGFVIPKIMLLIRPLNEFYHIIFLKIMQSYYVSQLKLYNSSPYTYQEVYAIVKFLLVVFGSMPCI